MSTNTNLTEKQAAMLARIQAARWRGVPSVEFFADERSVANALVRKGLVKKMTQGDSVRRGQRAYVCYVAAE